MTSDEYAAACDREIRKAEDVCGKNAPQAQLVGHLSGEVVRLRELLQQMLDVAENADETGYVPDAGFVDLDDLHATVRAKLES